MDSSRNIVKKLRENRILKERKDYENMERNELIRLAQEGDQLAFTTLLNTHKDFLYRMTHKYFSSVADKEDLMQSANVGFWQAVNQYDVKSNGDFEAYAGMIIKRRLTDEIRKDQAGKNEIHTGADSLDRDAAEDGEGGSITVGDTIASKSLSPEEEYLGQDGANKLMEFIRTELTEVECRCILRNIQGYKVAEISEVENMKYKSVENALMRAKAKIREFTKSMKESKKLRKDEGAFFSDEEKEVLKSVITKVHGDILHESVENLQKRLDEIDAEITKLQKELISCSDVNSYEEIIDSVRELKEELLSIEDEVDNDDDYEVCQQLYSRALHLETMDPENLKSEDPYTAAGMSRSDF